MTDHPDAPGNGEQNDTDGVEIPVAVGTRPEQAAAAGATSAANETEDSEQGAAAEPSEGPGDEDEGEGTEVARLRAELVEARARLAETHDRLLRKAAELKNTQRRHEDQMAKVKKFGIEDAVKEMLPVLDDLELAIEHATQPADGKEPPTLESFVDGVTLVKKKFGGVLERFGIVGFESVGQPFDPTIHEAISQQTTDEVPPGTVVSEFLKGYMIHDRLLRPALVVVSRAS